MPSAQDAAAVEKTDSAAFAPRALDGARQGGETCASATVISGPLPYTDAGTTVGHTKDYSQPYCGDGTGPDVVYAFSPYGSQLVTVSLCGSGDENDTVLWIYRGNCDGYPVAWNDDSTACGNLNSEIVNVPMPAGDTYYIVIAGNAYTTVDYVLNVTSVPLVTGACCFCTSACMETNESDCIGRAGAYSGDGTTCSTVTCTSQTPVNDDCHSVTPVLLENGVPQVFVGNNACATNDCGMVSNPQVWIAFTTTETADLVISYCGTWPTQTTVSVWMFDACPCGAAYYSATTSGWDCPDGSVNFNATWAGLTPGTYYYGVQMAPGTEGPYHVTVTATVPVFGACCVCDGTCTEVTPKDCTAQFGEYGGDNSTCAEASCAPVPPPVNNYCQDVVPVTLQDGIPEEFTGDTRCAAATCSIPGLSGVVWHAFTLDWPARVSVDFCGTSPAFTNFAWILFDRCPCGSPIFRDTFSWKACGDGNLTFGFNNLGSGTYYLPVMASGQQANGPYTAHVTATRITGGACCMCDNSCRMATAAGCATLDGLYNGDNTECATTQCAITLPPNAYCSDVTPVPVTPGVPLVFNGNSHCGPASCSVLSYGEVWEAFTLSRKTDVTISFCGTNPRFGTAYIVLMTDCSCANYVFSSDYNWYSCGTGDTNVSLFFYDLPAGTYFYPVSYSPANQANGPYTLTISTPAATGGCCVGSDCTVTTRSNCVTLGGRYVGDYTDCGGVVYEVGQGGDFENISGTGVEFPPAEVDDGGGTLALPFTFNFYGVDQTTVGISSNGYLTFGTDFTYGYGTSFPNTSVPNAMIAPFWTDVVATPVTAPVQYETRGAAPHRRFIVQWTNVPVWTPSGNMGSNTFQVVLFETTNNIEFRYQDYDAPNYQGVEAGIENADGTVGLETRPLVYPYSAVSLTWFDVPSPCRICRGDCDCNGVVNFSDIDYFVEAIPDDQVGWAALYAARHGGAQPPCDFANCDTNGDGHVNFADIDPFVALIPSTCPR